MSDEDSHQIPKIQQFYHDNHKILQSTENPLKKIRDDKMVYL